MTAASNSIVEIIQHYQRSIERCQDDETRLLHCIQKLYKLPIKVQHLQATGIGKTVNSLRKFNGEISIASKALVTKWKAMVAAEEVPTETSAVEHDNGMTQQPPSNEKASSDDDDDALDNTRETTAVNYEKPKHSSSKSREKEKEKHSQSQRAARDSESGNRNETAKEHRREKSSAPSKHHSSSSHHRKSESRDSEKASSHHHKSRDGERDKHDQKRKERRKETKSTDDTGKKDTAAASSSSSRHREKIQGSGDRDCSKSRHKRHGGHEKTTDPQAREKENKHRADSKERRRPSTSKDKEGHNDAKISKDAKRDREKSASKNKEDQRDKRKSSSSKSSPPCSGSAKPTTAVITPQIHSARSPTSPARPERKRPHDGDNDCSKDEPSPSAKAKVRKLVSSTDNGNNEHDEGIDSSMGANFADVLGMLNMPTKKTRKTLPNAKSATASTSSSSSKPVTTVANDQPNPTSRSSLPPSKIAKVLPPVRTNPDEKPELLLSAAKLAPLDPSIALALPTISTNYRPMPLNQTVMDCVFNSGQPSVSQSVPRTPARSFSDAEALNHGISSKTMRTKIYSGVKTGQIHQVPSLFALCIRVLQKNIDALEYTGGVPFEVLRPVLERATPQQLLVFEEYNPYLMEDSDELWRIHCSRNYRVQKRQEMESWREMFLRCQDDQDRKLSILAESIKQSQKEIAAPVRKTQLAFVDSMVKPPRNIQRKQEQFGTKAKLIATPASRVASLSSVTPNAVQTGDVRLRVAASVRDPAQIGSSQMRPKKAPLMAKALQLMRGRQNR